MSVRRGAFSEDAGDRAPASLNNPPRWINCFLGSFGFISRICLLKSSVECLGKGGQNSEGSERHNSGSRSAEPDSFFTWFSQVAAGGGRGPVARHRLLWHCAERWQKPCSAFWGLPRRSSSCDKSTSHCCSWASASVSVFASLRRGCISFAATEHLGCPPTCPRLKWGKRCKLRGAKKNVRLIMKS